jgi:hypothetical protein
MWNQTMTMRDPNNPNGPPIQTPYSFDINQGPQALAENMLSNAGSGSINYSQTGIPVWQPNAPNTGTSGMDNVPRYDPTSQQWLTLSQLQAMYPGGDAGAQMPTGIQAQGYSGDQFPWETQAPNRGVGGFMDNYGWAMPFALIAAASGGAALAGGAGSGSGAGAAGAGAAGAGAAPFTGAGSLAYGAGGYTGLEGAGLGVYGTGAGGAAGLGALEGSIDMPFGEDYAGAAKTQTNPFSDAYDTYKKGKGIYDQFKGLLGGDTSSQQQMRQQGSSLPGTDWMKLGDQGKLERFMKEGGDFSQLQAFTDKLNKKPEYPGF